MAHSANDSCVADIIALYDTEYASWTEAYSDVTQSETIRSTRASMGLKHIFFETTKECRILGKYLHWWRHELKTSFLSHHFKSLCIGILNSI